MNDRDDTLEGSESRKSRTGLLGWSALLAAGWLLYELTAQPNLSAAFVCFKFGWNDFKTAFWLGRRDELASRGLACSVLYLASGLWKVAMMALLTIFVFAFLAASLVDRRPDKPGQQAMPAWLGTVALTAILGIGMSSLASWIALWLAWIYGLKLWLSPSVHRARERQCWPPCDIDSSPINHAGRVLLSALIVTISPVAVTVFTLLSIALSRVGLQWLGVIVGIGGVFGILPTAILVLRDTLNTRVVARTPWECWSLGDPRDGFGWEDNLRWLASNRTGYAGRS